MAKLNIITEPDPILRKKSEVIEAYFGKSGNQYNMGRTHINSCDFSLENYALCETEDRKLKDFSIQRDKKMLIPFIKAALERAFTPIHIMASPWSPPPWMKTNNQMNHGGKLKEEYRDTWAEYYCRYIKFYEEDGVPIWGISVQNGTYGHAKVLRASFLMYNMESLPRH